jgi:hypothetical protein
MIGIRKAVFEARRFFTPLVIEIYDYRKSLVNDVPEKLNFNSNVQYCTTGKATTTKSLRKISKISLCSPYGFLSVFMNRRSKHTDDKNQNKTSRIYGTFL